MISSLLFALGTISGPAVAAPSWEQLAHSSPSACVPLVSSQGTSFERWSVRFYRPGSYCLSQDLKQTELPAWLRLPHMAVPHEWKYKATNPDDSTRDIDLEQGGADQYNANIGETNRQKTCATRMVTPSSQKIILEPSCRPITVNNNGHL